MSDIAVRVENLGKCYQIGQAKSGDFRESFGSWMDRLRGRSNGHGQEQESKEFWALKDINFEIKKGEAVGIIGRNGAGKSTLLKILSRITEPTKGRFEINGRVSSLLEVGTGFHPELSGRENIYLNGTILGMKRREIKAKFGEIVAFSGVEKFIDTPVKHYSSGMKVRLAFSVAAHLEPEILIVDEVLAVGDAEFQKKCLGKMEDVTEQGRTVVFVSHDMSAIQRLCTRGVLLKEGKVIQDGGSNQVSAFYYHSSGFSHSWYQEVSLNHLHFKSINVSIGGRQPNLVLTINFSLISVSDHWPAHVAFHVTNSHGVPIMQAIPELQPFIFFDDKEQNYECLLDLNGLVPDVYHLTAWVGVQNVRTYDSQREIVNFEILDSPSKGHTFSHKPEYGAIVPFSNIKKVKRI